MSVIVVDDNESDNLFEYQDYSCVAGQIRQHYINQQQFSASDKEIIQSQRVSIAEQIE